MNRPPGTLVLLRHAQSLWNLENRFSGWADMDLSPGGIADLLTQRMQVHEKNAWMLRSLLER